MKKCYFGEVDGDEGFGIAVVAEDVGQAKKILWPYLHLDFGLDRYIDMKVHQVKSARVEDLPPGYVFDSEEKIQEGVERGAYGFAEEGQCKECHKLSFIYHVNFPPFAVCKYCKELIDDNPHVSSAPPCERSERDASPKAEKSDGEAGGGA